MSRLQAVGRDADGNTIPVPGSGVERPVRNPLEGGAGHARLADNRNPEAEGQLCLLRRRKMAYSAPRNNSGRRTWKIESWIRWVYVAPSITAPSAPVA